MSAKNWSNPNAKGILIGLHLLPTPIVEHMRRTIGGRPAIENVYHVTELLYCLRKAYNRRIYSNGDGFDNSSLWNIYRGTTFDYKFSPLFDINQKTYHITKEHLTITGTLDFVWIDEKNFDPILYDLKMPKNTFYKKSSGAGKFYTEQVQTYLAMAHANNELMHVHRARVLMLADDLVIQEVQENDEILNYLWERAFILDDAVKTHKTDPLEPLTIVGPEEEWECREPFCPGDLLYRLECKKYPK